MATRQKSGGRSRGGPRRSPGTKSKSRGSRTRVRPVEMAAGMVFLALVAGALAWTLAAAAGLDPSSWHHGLVTGIAIGAVAAAGVGALVRPAIKKAAKSL